MFFDSYCSVFDFVRDISRKRACTREEGINNRRLYEMLDIPSTSTCDEIKKAYRNKILKCHPDHGGDPSKFNEIRYAYDILSDENKRYYYDRFGEEFLKEDISFDRDAAPKKTEDIRQHVQCPLEDMYNGKSYKIQIKHKVVCKACGGKGGSDDYCVMCPKCCGRGVIHMEKRNSFIQHVMEMTCDACNGQGLCCNPSHACLVCQGSKVVSDTKMVSFEVKKGMKSGSEIRITGAADEKPGYLPGDIILILQEKRDPRFERKDSDLLLSLNISLGEALCGVKRTLHHLDNHTITIQSKPGEVLYNGAIKAIPNEGMPVEEEPMKRGMLYIRFLVDTTTQLSKQQIDLIASAFSIVPPSINPGETVLYLESVSETNDPNGSRYILGL